MLYENDKLDEEDVLETFHQSEVHNDFCKSHLLVDDFSSKFRCRRAADEFPARLTRHGQRRRGPVKQTNSCSSSFSFLDLKLSYIIIAVVALDDGANN